MGIFNRRRAKPRDKPPAASAVEMTGLGIRAADWCANRSEAICAAAARMANTLASSPLHLYQLEEKQSAHSLEALVNYSPAPGWNSFSFKRDMEFARCSVGRCYAWVIRDEFRLPTQIRYLDAGRVTTLRERETEELWHRVTLPDGKNGYIHDSDMLYLTWLSNAGGVTPMSVLGGTLEYDAQIKSFSLQGLDGVHDVILIKAPGNVSGDRRAHLVEDILTSYQASGKRALVLDSGMDASRLSSSPVDPKMLDVERVTKTRVAGVYGMQPHMLGDGETGSRSTEEEMQHFLNMSILPAMAQWESELNRKLLSQGLWQDGYCFRFDVSALTRANTASLAEKYFKGVRGSFIRPNEVRAMEGLPPDPDGDRLMISRDLVPLDIAVNHPEQLLGGQRGKANGEGEDS
ncbi:MAG: phage portal protein [Deltaproteobacteria bacterium]|nr:phage portal protein [Deltaproteobacteria bacterium]